MSENSENARIAGERTGICHGHFVPWQRMRIVAKGSDVWRYPKLDDKLAEKFGLKRDLPYFYQIWLCWVFEVSSKGVLLSHVEL